MKVKTSVKKRCIFCKFIRRNGRLYVYCKRSRKHNCRQG